MGLSKIFEFFFRRPVESARIGEAAIVKATQAIRASIRPKETPKPRESPRPTAPETPQPSRDVRYSIASGLPRDAALQGFCGEIAGMATRNMAFGRELMALVRIKHGGKASLCYRAAGISRQVYSRIISDPTSRVARRTAYQLCIGLALNRAEADAFLAKAGYAFTPHDIESQAFAYCLQHGIYNLFDVNDILVRLGCEPISIG